MSHRMRHLAALIVLFTATVRSDCECGYTVTQNDSSTSSQLYTDLIETNFLQEQNITQNTDWRVQTYAAKSQRPYARNVTKENVIANPLAESSTLDGPGILGGDPGLQLWVRGGPPIDNYVPSAEIATRRKDMLYGSIRLAAKMTSLNGTCSAMFTYFNDTQEIDIELLSRNYAIPSIPPQSPLNLVLHSVESIQAGFQDPNTTDYGKPVLPVDLTNAFHEYRFDWFPGRVSFFFDGEWVWDLNSDNVPSVGSPFLMNHWSNGAPGWSLGPPTEDAVMTVSYFKAYFNSSDPQRANDFDGRCMDPNRPSAVCSVPNQVGAPNSTVDGAANGANDTAVIMGQSTGAQTFFFSEQNNQTVNQTVYNSSDDSASEKSGSGSTESDGSEQGAESGTASAAIWASTSRYSLGWAVLGSVIVYFL